MDNIKEQTKIKQEPVLEVKDLTVDFFTDDEWFKAVDKISYSVYPGEVLAIVGESGSGKTQSSMSLIGLLPSNGKASGSAKLAGQELLTMGKRQLHKVRGEEISVIFQEPMTALNPVYTIGFQITETIRQHKSASRKAAKKRALELLRLVGMPDPEKRLNYYPSQLSGGQRQRAMIAQALCLDPKILIADEPTTALDVTVQAEILELIRELKTKIKSSIILITHDMGVVADMADRVCVMKDGHIVETGSAEKIFYNPEHPYTNMLLDAVPHLGGVTPALEPKIKKEDYFGKNSKPLLMAQNVNVVYPRRGSTPAFHAVKDFALEIAKGEVVGLVGESGSGKTTFGRAIVGLLPTHSGALVLDGVNMIGIKRRALQKVHKKVSMVFQDPGSSLNPRFPIGESIGEPLLLAKQAKGNELNKRVEELLDQVKLPKAFRNRYPHELSGGQRQRVGIARALSLKPELLIADEPTSALDVSVQAIVLDLFQDLQKEYGFACLFISHDLAVVEILASTVIVMHKGRLVEEGPTEKILKTPSHNYTKKLLASVPVPSPRQQKERREQRKLLINKEN